MALAVPQKTAFGVTRGAGTWPATHPTPLVRASAGVDGCGVTGGRS